MGGSELDEQNRNMQYIEVAVKPELAVSRAAAAGRQLVRNLAEIANCWLSLDATMMPPSEDVAVVEE